MSTTLAQRITEGRRSLVLRALDEDGERRLSEVSIKRVLDHMDGIIYPDVLRAVLVWLEEQQLLRLERSPLPGGGEMWVATLTEAGMYVAHGRPHPGVERAPPKR